MEIGDLATNEVEEHEATAYRVGAATLQDQDGGTVDEVKFIEIWTPEAGEWRIHRDIWNLNRPEDEG